MIKLSLRYVAIIKKKTGRAYFYWNRPGFPLVSLAKYGEPSVATSEKEITEKISHPLFVAKVHDLNAKADANIGPVSDDGSFRWLIRSYEQSADFKGLRPRTKENYRHWLR